MADIEPDPRYSRWHQELDDQRLAAEKAIAAKQPVPPPVPGERHNIDTDICGFWRIHGAKTKIDWPCAIWPSAEGPIVVKVGDRAFDEGTSAWHEFLGDSWLFCTAVTHEEYHKARSTKFWSDGKVAGKVSVEEKLDIIPDTPASEGGNAAGDEGESYAEQIDRKIKAEVAKSNQLGAITDMAKAEAAAAIVDKIRALGKLGNARREEDRAPHLAAAQAVQNVWVAVLTPGSAVVSKLTDEIEAFKKAEKARLQAIANEDARVERARLQAIADEAARVERERRQKLADAENERIRQENEKILAAAALDTSGLSEVPKTLQEVVPEAVEVVEVQVAAAEVEAPKVSAAFGKAISKPRRKTGLITDKAKFIAALAGQTDFEEFLQDKADKLARANTALAGMEIVNG